MNTIRIFLLVFLTAGTATAQFVKSAWTATADPATARAGLGIYETNAAAYNVTNVFTNFSVPVLTIGLGTNAVTLAPTNGTITSDVDWIVSNLTVNGGITLGGTRRTTWPEGGTNSTATTNSTGTRYYLSFQTNAVASFPITIGTLTNGAAYYDLTPGTNGSTYVLEASTNGGADWFTAEGGYNASAEFRFSVQLSGFVGSPYVSNLSVFSVENFSTLGATNDYTLQVFRVAGPVNVSDAATKSYVDTTARTEAEGWANHPAVADVRLNNNPLRPDALWTLGRTAVSNAPRLAFSFAGNELLTLSPGYTGISNGVSISTTSAVVTISVATNNAPGPFRVLCSTNDFDWFTEIAVTNSYPTAVGTNYTLTFPAPTGPGAWVYQVGRSNAPSVIFQNVPWPTNELVNFTAEQLYTNGPRRAYVSASITMAPTASEDAVAWLWVDNDASGAYDLTAQHRIGRGVSTNVSSSFQLSAFIQPGAVFKFTKFTGVPAITVLGGTSQWIYP